MFFRSKRFAALVFGGAITGLAIIGTSVQSAEPTAPHAASTITIDAYWLRLAPEQLPVGRASIPPALLTDASILYARARAVGFDGQEVTTDVTRTVSVVTGTTPVVAPGAVAYDLTTSPEKFGLTLAESPTQIDAESLVLSFDSTVTMQQENPPATPATRPSTDPANPTNPMVINSAHEVVGTSSVVLHAKSEVQLKTGVPTIVSGMSDRPGSADGRTLCLVLCATISPSK